MLLIVAKAPGAHGSARELLIHLQKPAAPRAVEIKVHLASPKCKAPLGTNAPRRTQSKNRQVLSMAVAPLFDTQAGLCIRRHALRNPRSSPRARRLPATGTHKPSPTGQAPCTAPDL